MIICPPLNLLKLPQWPDVHQQKNNKMELRNKITLALNEIRPFLAADGGDISLVEILDEKIVKVKLHGNCAGCSVNQMTLKTGVEMTIKKHAPQIEKVVNVDEK